MQIAHRRIGGMANLSSVATYITVEASRYRSAVSEFLIQTIGKSINYLLDKTDAIETAIEGESFSSVTTVSFNLTIAGYTVPAGNTLFAVLRNIGTAAHQFSTDGFSTNTQLDYTSGVGESTGVIVGAGTTLNSDTNNEIEARGILISSTTITIP